jgi:hypothetical protein
VDLYKTRHPQKRFGGMDQIFPHELAHIIMRQLAGEAKKGGSNQLHAIGVRTDPQQAFSEGFAEHCQIMALEDPDADPEIRALTSDAGRRRLAEETASQYLQELEAHWFPAGPMRMGFLLWFSGTEQAWRYYEVKQNAFARQRALILLAIASVAGAFLYRRIRSVGWFRAAVNGLAASLLVLGLAWLTTGTRAHIAFLGPIVLLAAPAALLRLARYRDWFQAARVLLAWAAAAIPSVLLAYPWM